MARRDKISRHWKIDPENPHYCLTTPLRVAGGHSQQKIFLTTLSHDMIQAWESGLKAANPKTRATAEQALLYAKASYMRYSSPLFRRAGTDDWLKLRATRTDSPGYIEQTFVLAASSGTKCDLKQAHGLCLVRRSWANNLFLDYLARGPQTYTGDRMTGIAEGLVYCVLLMGLELKCRYLYLEPSREAVPFYSRLLHPKISDLEKIPIRAALTRAESVLESIMQDT
jgi:hypothetical protein